ncbi:MAG TPA: type II secretion system protein [Rhizobacter sp.]|nr:type II secretion system protein [Rhizobacter sp.]
MLMVVLAVLAVTTGVVSAGENIARRNAEQALLAVGEELRSAIVSFRAAGGNGASSGPKELSDLLRDPRMAGVRRHLRRIPVDPLTGAASWGLVRDATGGIAAVYSLAEGRPIKRDNFEAAQAGFENADSYARWWFGVSVPLR